MRVQPWALICTTTGAEQFPKEQQAPVNRATAHKPRANKKAASRRLAPHRSVSYSDPYGLSAEECCDRPGFEGDPKNVERAVQYSQNASTSERVVAGVLFAGANAVILPAALPGIVANGRRMLRSLTQAADDGVSARTPVGHRGKPLQVQPGSNRPTTIGGRRYSGHALDRMQERGLTPTVIEDAVRNGVRSAGNDPGTFVHVTDAARVITGRAGNIITVMPR